MAQAKKPVEGGIFAEEEQHNEILVERACAKNLVVIGGNPLNITQIRGRFRQTSPKLCREKVHK